MTRTCGCVAGARVRHRCSAALILAHDRITTKVTWDREIAPIVRRAVCLPLPGGRAPMPLTTYEEARPWAKAIKEEVLARRMPKWHVVRGYGDFRTIRVCRPSRSPWWRRGLMAVLPPPLKLPPPPRLRRTRRRTRRPDIRTADTTPQHACSSVALCGADIPAGRLLGTAASCSKRARRSGSRCYMPTARKNHCSGSAISIRLSPRPTGFAIRLPG